MHTKKGKAITFPFFVQPYPESGDPISVFLNIVVEEKLIWMRPEP
jgi:hypothetical protein